MCCKKWVGGLAAVVLLVLGLSLFGATEPGRFVYGHAWVQVQKLFGWMGKQVTVEDEIARIENEVNGLSKDMAVEYDKVAQTRQKVKQSEKDVTEQQAKLDKQWEAVDRLTAMLEKAKSDGATRITIEGKESDLPTIRADIADRWNDFKRGKESLAKKQEVLEKQQAVLAQMNDNLKKLATVQDDLKLKLKDLQTQVESARLAEKNQKDVAVSEELNNRLKHINDSIDAVQINIDNVVQQAKDDANRPALKKDVGIDKLIKAENALDEIAKYKQSKVAADK